MYVQKPVVGYCCRDALPKTKMQQAMNEPQIFRYFVWKSSFSCSMFVFLDKGRERQKERKKERKKEGRKEGKKEGRKERRKERERKKERKKESHRSLPSLSRIYMSRGLARFAIVSIGPDTLWEWNTAMKHRIGMEHQSVQFDWRMFFLPGSFNHQQTHPKQAFFK